MTYFFGQRSIDNMVGVQPDLVRCNTLALSICAVDYGVPEQACRTHAEEAAKVAAGTSHTLKSMHIVQADGFGHAIDDVPWIAGAFTWDVEQAFYEIAAAMQSAAIQLGLDKVYWGGMWDVPLAKLPIGAAALKAAHQNYMAAFHAQHGRYPFVDLPHFQLAL